MQNTSRPLQRGCHGQNKNKIMIGKESKGVGGSLVLFPTLVAFPHNPLLCGLHQAKKKSFLLYSESRRGTGVAQSGKNFIANLAGSCQHAMIRTDPFGGSYSPLFRSLEKAYPSIVWPHPYNTHLPNATR